MAQLPNPFLNSTVSPRAVGSAVASSDLQPRATAEQISQSTLDPATGVDAAAGPEFADPPVPAAVAISSSCGGTNAHQSRERCADNRPAFSEAVEVASGPHEAIPSNGGRCQETPASAPSKNPDVGVLADRIDWHAFFEAVMDERIVLFELYDEVPLFLRDGDHLRRWEA